MRNSERLALWRGPACFIFWHTITMLHTRARMAAIGNALPPRKREKVFHLFRKLAQKRAEAGGRRIQLFMSVTTTMGFVALFGAGVWLLCKERKLIRLGLSSYRWAITEGMIVDSHDDSFLGSGIGGTSGSSLNG